MEIVDNIKVLCIKNSTTIPKLEKTLGFGNGTIYNWSKSSPSLEKLQKVANFFKVEIDELVGWGNIFDIGWFIEEERVQQGMALEELSHKLNIQPETLSQIEENIIPISSELLNAITSVFGITVQEFLIKYEMYDEAIDEYFKGDVNAYLEFKKAEEQNVLSKSYEPKTIAAPKEQPYYALTDKDEHDIAKMLEEMMDGLGSGNQAFQFMGEPMDDEDRELLRISLENTLRMSKQMAKKKFTPKKYRNEE
ncbi:helix-turn-helix transcriptional regulator [Paenibacillus sp. FSL K6-2524]|uniref:helix-turn-helix transcriptional regulator n=1 Tax=Paenibacillus sp. FSL K6-2524 TaxID=2954516 RepID=UPI0030FAB2FE